MYDKQIPIPAKGERTTVSDVAGKALQTTRLDFLGSEDPKGNPIIEADAGRLSARMVVGDPIEKEFSGLVVRNPDSAEAAGTVAIVRVYEEGDVISRVPRKRQMVRQAKPEPDDAGLYERMTIGGNGGDVKALLSGNRDRAYRVYGITVRLQDDSLSTGYQVTCEVLYNGSDIDAETKTVGVGDDFSFTLSGSFLALKKYPVDARVVGKGSNGDGQVQAEFKGMAIFDRKSEIPPR